MDDGFGKILMYGVVIWMIYMWTFRAEQFEKLSDNGQRRVGRAFKGMARFGWFCFRNYRRFK